MRSPRAPGGCWRGFRSAQAHTGSASGRSPAAIRSVIPTTCVSAALVVVLAGCGGGAAKKPNAVVTHGESVFTSSCAGCHTLTGHDTTSPGGDLAVAKLSEAII